MGCTNHDLLNVYNLNGILGGGFKYFCFAPKIGEAQAYALSLSLRNPMQVPCSTPCQWESLNRWVFIPKFSLRMKSKTSSLTFMMLIATHQSFHHMVAAKWRPWSLVEIQKWRCSALPTLRDIHANQRRWWATIQIDGCLMDAWMWSNVCPYLGLATHAWTRKHCSSGEAEASQSGGWPGLFLQNTIVLVRTWLAEMALRERTQPARLRYRNASTKQRPQTTSTECRAAWGWESFRFGSTRDLACRP